MEIPMSQIGTILHHYFMAGYFETDNLEEALQQLIDDQETSIGIDIQQPKVDTDT